MRKRFFSALLAAIMVFSLLPNVTRADTLEGLFAGKFRAGSQIFDCQRSVDGNVGTASYLSVPYARVDQFSAEELENRYFAFRDTGRTTTSNGKTVPIVGLYLFNAADDTPTEISGKSGANGFVNEGKVLIVADEGILYTGGSNDRWGYLISNAAGCSYYDHILRVGFTSENPLYLRENSVVDPSLSELKSFEATNILLDEGQILLRFYANGENVTDMPNPPYRTKAENVDFTIDASLTPSRNGYTFTGWNRRADGTGTTYLPGAVYKSNVGLSLYAQWVTSSSSEQTQSAPAGVNATNASVRGGNGALTNTTTAMQYRTADDSNTWYWCTASSTAVPAGEYWVRYAPKEGYSASPEAYVGKVLEPAETPVITDFTVTHLTAIGANNGTITPNNTGVSYEYRTTSTGAYQNLSGGKIEDLPVGAVTMRVKAVSGVSLASQPLTLRIKQPAASAPPASSFTVTHVTTFRGYDGQISGVNSTMQYLEPGWPYWQDISSNPVEWLRAGDYQIRYAETDTTLASDSTTVTVNHSAPSGLGATDATTDGGNGAITGTDDDMEYSADNLSWTACAATSTAVPAGTYSVRYRGSTDPYDTFPPSPAVSITVKQPSSVTSAKPTASVSAVNKTAATQPTVIFTLTNSPAYANGQVWRVYADATNSVLANGITAANIGNTLTLSHAANLPAGEYYVSVTESGKTESDRLKLTIGAYVPSEPMINAPIQDQTVTVAVGNTATFSVTAQNALHYRWQQSTDGGTTWYDVGTDDQSYTTSPVAIANNGYKYCCTVSGEPGTTPVTSFIFTLQVVEPGAMGDVGPDVPKTGDGSRPGLWLGLAMLAGVGLFLLRKKRRA